MRFWGYRTPNFWCVSISSNEIPYLASILGFAGTREILARYSPRAERPLSFLSGKLGSSEVLAVMTGIHLNEEKHRTQYVYRTILQNPTLQHPRQTGAIEVSMIEAFSSVSVSLFKLPILSKPQLSPLSSLPAKRAFCVSINNLNSNAALKARSNVGPALYRAVTQSPFVYSHMDLENEKIRFKTHNREATHQSFMNHMRCFEAEATGIVVINSAFNYSSEELAKPPNFVNSSLFERGRRDIVVATPGRLTDVLNTIPAVRQNLATAKTLIMDEAATLLEMGFKEEIDDIVRQLPAKEERSTYLFSATISPKIHRIAQQTMKKDTKIVDCVPSGETNVHAHVPQYCAYRPP
ncbi:hypothetical protein PCANC_02812 [Puccinia coronata f. sp. avenae]|uniref:RNA helicase n=1 Tax=Puccinia coronata f. sp. avenae TaxID=200324 RepID=A0A2N5W3Z8_9BASI|nr:hypothetical protein PCANC_02812 [Puccinia coronata f. sp. avenae]